MNPWPGLPHVPLPSLQRLHEAINNKMALRSPEISGLCTGHALIRAWPPCWVQTQGPASLECGDKSI